MESRPLSQPITVRCGDPPGFGASSACTSISTGREPSSPANTALPATLPRAARRGTARSGWHLRQAGVGHLEHPDLVGGAETVLHGAQDAELMAAVAFETQHGIDHVLQHSRPGDTALLGNVADQHQREVAGLGQADQLERRRAHLRDGARRAFDRVHPHRLDRVVRPPAW